MYNLVQSYLSSLNNTQWSRHNEAVSKAQDVQTRSSWSNTRKMSTGEREFIFDAVVGFLTSPIWNTPVRSFIEQNSLGMTNFS